MRLSLVPVLLTAVLALPGTAFAQDDEAPEDWYEVEVVVFLQPERMGAGQEAWLPVPEPFGGIPLVSPGPASARADAPPYSRLRDDALQLGDIRDRLSSTSEYEVLLHTGWQQPGYGDDRAGAVVLPLGWEPPPIDLLTAWRTAPQPLEDTVAGNGPPASPFALVPPSEPLYGTLRLIRRRYLHVETDLRYRRADAEPSVSGATALAIDDGGPDAGAAPVIVYPLQQRRRMRSGEIHYLDHPALGLIVQVRRVEREPPREPADTDSATAAE